MLPACLFRTKSFQPLFKYTLRKQVNTVMIFPIKQSGEFKQFILKILNCAVNLLQVNWYA